MFSPPIRKVFLWLASWCSVEGEASGRGGVGEGALKALQQMKKIRWGRGADAEELARRRVQQLHAAGMKGLAGDIRRWGAIEIIAEQGVADGGKVDSDLMGAACNRRELEE